MKFMKYLFLAFLFIISPLVAGDSITDLEKQVLAYDKQIRELELKRNVLKDKIAKLKGFQYKKFKLVITEELKGIEKELTPLQDKLQDAQDEFSVLKTSFYSRYEKAKLELTKFTKDYKTKKHLLKRDYLKSTKEKGGKSDLAESKRLYKENVKKLDDELDRKKQKAKKPSKKSWEIASRKITRKLKRAKESVNKLKNKYKSIVDKQKKDFRESQKNERDKIADN